ncbi:MAG: hypothetical protein GXY55_04200 [Phycisphaerae bacterium]|nr:hypothetical protein [Phycisphaerae bacterium]
MNRVAGGRDLFEGGHDDAAFEPVLAEAREREAMRVCAYALMPNHLCPELWPRAEELERLRACIRRGRPYGDERWTSRTATTLDLKSTLRPVGWPEKK